MAFQGFDLEGEGEIEMDMNCTQKSDKKLTKPKKLFEVEYSNRAQTPTRIESLRTSFLTNNEYTARRAVSSDMPSRSVTDIPEPIEAPDSNSTRKTV